MSKQYSQKLNTVLNIAILVALIVVIVSFVISFVNRTNDKIQHTTGLTSLSASIVTYTLLIIRCTKKLRTIENEDKESRSLLIEELKKNITYMLLITVVSIMCFF